MPPDSHKVFIIFFATCRFDIESHPVYYITMSVRYVRILISLHLARLFTLNICMVQARKESTLEKKDKTFLIKDHDSLSGKMFKSFPSQRVQRCEYKQSHTE